MDIFCPRCGEPVDNDALHDEAVDRDNATHDGTADRTGDPYDVVFRAVQADFRKRGCEALKMRHNEDVNIGAARAASALMEIMPDDFDGVAAMMQDAGF